MIDPNGLEGSAFFHRTETGLQEAALEEGRTRVLRARRMVVA